MSEQEQHEFKEKALELLKEAERWSNSNGNVKALIAIGYTILAHTETVK